MAATLTEIREGIRAALKTAFPTTCQISAYMLDSPNPPTMQVMGPDAVQYDQAMGRGLDEWTIVLQVFAGGPTDRGAQQKLDDYLAPTGASSVKAALETHDGAEHQNTLGGKVQDLQVTRSSGYRIYNLPNRGETLGCEFFIRIFTTGN